MGTCTLRERIYNTTLPYSHDSNDQSQQSATPINHMRAVRGSRLAPGVAQYPVATRHFSVFCTWIDTTVRGLLGGLQIRFAFCSFCQLSARTGLTRADKRRPPSATAFLQGAYPHPVPPARARRAAAPRLARRLR
eukprot:1129175-Prymnesium_polylepis.1